MANWPRNFRRGRSGKLSSMKQIIYGLKLLKLRRESIEQGIRNPKLSYRAIAREVGVQSPATIQQWDTKLMTSEAIAKRQNAKAPARKFTLQEEKILSGWVVYRDLTLQSSTTENFREFVYSYFGRRMSASYISQFMRRNRLSMKHVGKAEGGELDQGTIDTAVTFLRGLEIVAKLTGLSLSQIKVVDKTYLMTSPWHKFVKHMGIRGSNKPRKISPQRGHGTPSFPLLPGLFSFFSSRSVDNSRWEW